MGNPATSATHDMLCKRSTRTDRARGPSLEHSWASSKSRGVTEQSPSTASYHMEHAQHRKALDSP
ncbi:hypothetical protein SCLCIDRAFT_1219808 [Scleroderma citrinum Foug A]|uniref:Uncharacterized protein n=1 Tax=Scleroderma citrinum Foug A TaxID=1036808 RepID=A0A0C2Z4T5_9AGAM|nr:hypothetical protein SCLCIDRAFT_1219808 [Scleroderma citrinum Foug A]